MQNAAINLTFSSVIRNLQVLLYFSLLNSLLGARNSNNCFIIVENYFRHCHAQSMTMMATSSHTPSLSLSTSLCSVRGLSKKVTFNLFAGSHVCFNNSICTHISIICNRQFSYVGGVCTRKEESREERRKKSNIVYSIYISVITHTKPLLLLVSFSSSQLSLPPTIGRNSFAFCCCHCREQRT